MKQNRSRWIALLLALCLLVSAVPLIALADTGIETKGDYNSAVTRVKEALTKPDRPDEKEGQHTVTRTYQVGSIVTKKNEGEITMGGANKFDLPVAGTLTLRAAETAEAYRWQVYVGGVWANIAGETGSSVTLTCAKLQNAISDGEASVRCVLTSNGSEHITPTATVRVDETVETVSDDVEKQIDVTTHYQETLIGRAQRLNSAAVQANEGTYFVIIEYEFEDGSQAANPWTATIGVGTSQKLNVASPNVVGYTPDRLVVQETVSEATTIKVTYKPAEVNFTVKHYQQNVSNDAYTLVDTETKRGYTEAPVGENLDKTDYTGFYSLLYDTTTKIAADGSTVVEIRYDRKYYLMNFDLGGGYGVDPIYARYGAQIGDVGTPTRAGYEFKGWATDKDSTKSVTLPATMPAAHSTYYAIWEVTDKAKVTIVIWGENADDEEYSYIKSSEIQAKPGTTLTKDDLTHILTCGKEEHQHTNSCMNCAHTHTADCYGAIKQEQPVDGKTGSATENINQFKALTGGTLKNGMVYRVKCDGAATTKGYDKYYLYYDNTWYLVSSSNISGSAVASSKKVNAHEHSGNIISGNDKDQFWVYNSKLLCTHTHTVSCYICGKAAHKHNANCYTSPLDMDATRWKLVKSDEVTVAADGTTIMNVYYDRVEFTLHFRKENSDRDDYGTITGKWGSKILKQFKAKGTLANTTNWSENSDASQPWTTYLDIMPTENRTYYAYESGSRLQKANYYIEGLDGNDVLYYTSEARSDEKLYVSKEEFIEIKGFTFDAARSTKENELFDGAKFYYTRNSYTLSFYNYNAELTDKAQTVKYEAPLKNYDFTPDYPANLEPNAYKFAGWYTTEKCLKGTEVDWNNMIMPAADMMLYAKWVPVTHTVKFYLTEEDGKAGKIYNPGGEDGIASFAEPHGGNIAKKYVDSHLTKEAMLTANPRDPYEFVVWYYYEDDANKTGKKYFDPTMQIRQDMNLYAQWGSDVLVPYTIRYAVENADGTFTYIAEDTTGSALAGSTKTFDAKTGTQLNEGYQSGYFPKESSHSITMNIEGGNEFTFIYVAKPKVEYTVRYLEKGTGNQLAESKTVTTSDAIVTETFKQIKGYAPDAYQKRLVLAAEGNEIIFWYVKDEVHAPVQIIHWTQNIAGDGYTEYRKSSNLNGVIGTEYTETPLTIEGFTYNANPEHPVDGYPALASGELTAAGLVLNLYYDRIEYPYEFRFLEQGTDKKLAEPVTGKARYQAQVTQEAKNIPGYTLVSAENQAINIDIEDPADVASKNVKTFYYVEQTVEIKYVVVGDPGCGTLDNVQENNLKVMSGTVNGSTPTAEKGYTFVGWFKDAECTQPVEEGWVDSNNKKLTPQTTKNYGTEEVPVMGYEAATYYAKFVPATGDLKITKRGCVAIDENQSFVFTVKGNNNDVEMEVVIHGNSSVTIKDLPAGSYTVTEDTDWSWRYTPDGGATHTATVTGSKTETVTFNNRRDKDKWLDGNAYCDNKWIDSSKDKSN